MSSCNLVISSVSPGEIGLLPSDKGTKGQEAQRRHRGWLGLGETHEAEWRAGHWGGGVVCFWGSAPETHPHFKADLTLQFQSDPQGLSSVFGARLLPS